MMGYHTNTVYFSGFSARRGSFTDGLFSGVSTALVLLADLLLVAVVVLVDVVGCLEASFEAFFEVTSTSLLTLSALSTWVIPVQLPGPAFASVALSVSAALDVVLVGADFDPFSFVTFLEDEEVVEAGDVLLSLVLLSLLATAAVSVVAESAMVLDFALLVVAVAGVVAAVVVGLVLVGATLSAVGGSKGMVALVTLFASTVLVDAVADLPEGGERRTE